MKVTQEQVIDAIEYLTSLDKLPDLSKGNETADFDTSEKTNGGSEEKIKELQSKKDELLAKAKEIEDEMNSLKKGENEEEEEESPANEVPVKEDGEEEDDEVIEKSNKSVSILNSYKKSILTEVLNELNPKLEKFDEIVKSKNREIDELKNQVAKIVDQPIQKAFTHKDTPYLQKAFTGERTDDNKKVLSKRVHRNFISDILLKAFEKESDEMKKSMYENAVIQFESTGNYISNEVLSDLNKSHDIQIID